MGGKIVLVGYFKGGQLGGLKKEIGSERCQEVIKIHCTKNSQKIKIILKISIS